MGRTLEELQSHEKEVRGQGFRKRRNAHGQAKTITKEFFQWWDRKGVKRDGDTCIKCREPRAVKPNGSKSQFCQSHLVAHREGQRRRLGFKRRNVNSASYQFDQAG